MLGPRSVARVPVGNSVNNWVNKKWREREREKRRKKVQRERENAFKIIAALGRYGKFGAAATTAEESDVAAIYHQYRSYLVKRYPWRGLPPAAFPSYPFHRSSLWQTPVHAAMGAGGWPPENDTYRPAGPPFLPA